MSIIALQCAFGFASEANVATSNTGVVDLSLTDSNRILLVGTDTVTSWGSANNQYKLVRFANTVTIQNTASLLLKGVSSRTTSPGDMGTYTSNDSGVWREIDYSSFSASGVVAIQTITSSQTWTKPAGASKAIVLGVGGGATGTTGSGVPGVGGGSGAFGVKLVDLSAVNSVSVTIGAAVNTVFGSLLTIPGTSTSSGGAAPTADFAVGGNPGAASADGNTGGVGGASLFFGYGAGGNGSGAVSPPATAGSAGVILVVSLGG